GAAGCGVVSRRMRARTAYEVEAASRRSPPGKSVLPRCSGVLSEYVGHRTQRFIAGGLALERLLDRRVPGLVDQFGHAGDAWPGLGCRNGFDGDVEQLVVGVLGLIQRRLQDGELSAGSVRHLLHLI